MNDLKQSMRLYNSKMFLPYIIYGQNGGTFKIYILPIQKKIPDPDKTTDLSLSTKYSIFELKHQFN
jgi:hypothetical protein